MHINFLPSGAVNYTLDLGESEIAIFSNLCFARKKLKTFLEGIYFLLKFINTQRIKSSHPMTKGKNCKGCGGKVKVFLQNIFIRYAVENVK